MVAMITHLSPDVAFVSLLYHSIYHSGRRWVTLIVSRSTPQFGKLAHEFYRLFNIGISTQAMSDVQFSVRSIPSCYREGVRDGQELESVTVVCDLTISLQALEMYASKWNLTCAQSWHLIVFSPHCSQINITVNASLDSIETFPTYTSTIAVSVWLGWLIQDSGYRWQFVTCVFGRAKYRSRSKLIKQHKDDKSVSRDIRCTGSIVDINIGWRPYCTSLWKDGWIIYCAGRFR